MADAFLTARGGVSPFPITHSTVAPMAAIMVIPTENRSDRCLVRYTRPAGSLEKDECGPYRARDGCAVAEDADGDIETFESQEDVQGVAKPVSPVQQ